MNVRHMDPATLVLTIRNTVRNVGWANLPVTLWHELVRRGWAVVRKDENRNYYAIRPEHKRRVEGVDVNLP